MITAVYNYHPVEVNYIHRDFYGQTRCDLVYLDGEYASYLDPARGRIPTKHENEVRITKLSNIEQVEMFPHELECTCYELPDSRMFACSACRERRNYQDLLAELEPEKVLA
jgi:hypothetical protein